MRDDFSSSIKRTLASRVGSRCSNPICQRLTSGPDTAPMQSVNIGVACHISAASPGGPRYDESQASLDRKSITNGIWLCQICAKLIDSDLAKYTKEVLENWKETAEYSAAAEVQGISAQLPDGATPLIVFKSEDWKTWRHRGNLPGDPFFRVSIWEHGDIQYSVKLRLKNISSQEEILHRLKIEFRESDRVLFSDGAPFNEKDLVLPPKKWISLETSHGLHNLSHFQQCNSIWLKAELVGTDEVFNWKIIDVNHSSQTNTNTNYE